MKRSPVIALAACLRHEPPGDVDWTALIAAANRSWMTPQLLIALRESGVIDAAPDDVRDYLELIHGRNLLRNRRLRAQLREAVRALNAAGIAPTLVKGAVDIACERGERLGGRLMSDLDILVREGELEAARAALTALGYGPLMADHPPFLARPGDAGAIELHGWALPHSRYESLAGIEEGPVVTILGSARARIPPAPLRVLQLVIHDHIKEGDDWRGSVDLRHVHDIARMLQAGVDWTALRATPRRRRERAALEDALAMAGFLFGVKVPPAPGRTLLQRLRHRRRLAPLLHPVLGAPLRRAGDAAWACRRIAGGNMDWPRPGDLPRAARHALRDRSVVARFLMGPTIGPKV